jgi:hypothetical protein
MRPLWLLLPDNHGRFAHCCQVLAPRRLRWRTCSGRTHPRARVRRELLQHPAIDNSPSRARTAVFALLACAILLRMAATLGRFSSLANDRQRWPTVPHRARCRAHCCRADRFWVEGVDMTRSAEKATPFTVRVTMFGTTIGAPGWSGSYKSCRKRQTSARGVAPEH